MLLWCAQRYPVSHALYRLPCRVQRQSVANIFTLFRPNLRPPLTVNSTLSRWLSNKKEQERHENIYTIPNMLTLSRFVSAPVIAYFIINQQPILATSFLAYSTLTDLLDGWIARRYNMQSVVGTVIDPMADKALMLCLTLSLTYMGSLPGKKKGGDLKPNLRSSVASRNYSRPRCLARLLGNLL
jgi:hypothetical protein